MLHLVLSLSAHHCPNNRCLLSFLSVCDTGMVIEVEAYMKEELGDGSFCSSDFFYFFLFYSR